MTVTRRQAPDRQPDGRRLRGERTRAAVLDAAVELASTDGLDGLTLARLAGRLGVSKSGLFTHWPDKETLQLAVVERAREQWAERVVRPALEGRDGVRALWALHERRLAFYADEVLPGGCFFVTAQTEFDDRPGPVQDRLRAQLREWEGLMASLVRDAIRAGELRPGVSPGLLAYELDALGQGVVTRSRLLERDAAFAHARGAVLLRLRGLCVDPGLLPGS
ncbi:TetR/AcrR family transcriptional regulator [Streptomyces sp. WAC 01529]|uniref:TetR/AcrR family transcriptional regulator n=1 Tax=Streptomyces sp. WAC 01529 TaxID=2203205 RepID=UPI000F6FB2C9|nr:TetR/AcrR family transcriptional regulator [Streptomyces sp. WAC 01529]AZM54123.1 TetR/AcrR family transcriptional regulator [Streptomyces sp. WAC 01529]